MSLPHFWKFPNPDILTLFAERLFRTLVILIAAWIANRLARLLLASLRAHFIEAMKRRPQAELTSQVEIEKRANTISEIFKKLVGAMIWGLALVVGLREVGIDVRPILAGAGVVGLAVGFGAQNLVRDIITGLFMLLENQVRINDIAIINGVTGLVEEINLRTTVLRAGDGAVHVFPNGAITSLANLTLQYSYYVFDVEVPYKEDADSAIEAINFTAAELMLEEPYRDAILAPLEMMGVDKIFDGAVFIKARFRTLPNKQWIVGREMNRRIKKRFDKLNIAPPKGKKGESIRVTLDPGELRAIVRDEVKAALDGTPGVHRA